MCTSSCIIFGALSLTKGEVQDKKIIEIGSYDVNGSFRQLYEPWKPKEYIGVDIESGPGVDMICNAEDVLKNFGENSFDIVISTELLEHVENWRKVISNMKNICKPDGIIIITTRSKGFPYHGYPYDYWRYEIEDMNRIFSDFIVNKIENDKYFSGVFLKLRKPTNFIENNLSDYELFSIITNKRVLDIGDMALNNYLRSYSRKQYIRNKLKYILKKLCIINILCIRR